MEGKITVPIIKQKKGREKIKMVTAYDAPSARIADEAGADIILVGDSVATAVLGEATTLQATMDIIEYHTKAVARVRPKSLLVSDLPWLSFHISDEETIKNAGRLIKAGAEAVKLEGGKKRVQTIQRLLDTEIPVMGHLGLTPQSFNTMGGYKVQGKNAKVANELIEDAIAIADAGVFSIILEGIPDAIAKIITSEVQIPTIGIGAGIDCDGQVLVFHDALGLNFGHRAKFVREYVDLKKIAIDGLKTFFSDIEKKAFPAESESYHLEEAVLKEIIDNKKTKKQKSK